MEIDDEEVPECTLRAAIETLNNRARADSISFNIDGGGTHTITPGGPLPVAMHPMVLDATTQPGYDEKPLITLEGQGTIANGFVLEKGKSTVRGFAIGGFTNAGILITGAGENIIRANHIGVNAEGTEEFPNGTGILISNSPGNKIGGDQASHGNLVSGNKTVNIMIAGKDAKKNEIKGNIIGPDKSGTNALSKDAAGIVIAYGSENKIGEETDKPGTAPGNLISGHGQAGISISGIDTIVPGMEPEDPESVGVAQKNTIKGNLIGTDKSGQNKLGNAIGISLFHDAWKTKIGEGKSKARNVISGNKNAGIFLADNFGYGAPIGTEIKGNYIGVDISGNKALGNGASGIFLGSLSLEPLPNSGVPKVKIGGSSSSDRNIIAGNDSSQVHISGPKSKGTTIMNNYIGVFSSGKAAQSRSKSAYGIRVLTDGVYIGVDKDDKTAGNTISGHKYGILLTGKGHKVGANKIGTQPDGKQAVANEVGVWVLSDSTTIGGKKDAQGNLISGNYRYGVKIGTRPNQAYDGETYEPDGVAILNNKIGTNQDGDEALGNGRHESSDGAGAGVVSWRGKGLHLYRNVLSGNHHGVLIANSSSGSVTRMAGNLIGAAGSIPKELEDAMVLPGFTAMANLGDGVRITDGRVHLTGRADAKLMPDLRLGNVIMNNLGAGVRRTGSNLAAGLEITSNFFFGNTGLGIDLGPVGPGAGGDFHEPPVLSQPVLAGEQVRLRGVSEQSGDLQIYTTPVCHPSGHGEGRLHLGSYDREVTGGQEFSADISLPENLRAGSYLAALLTNDSRTSEFSRCMRVAGEDRFQEQLLDELADNSLELLRLSLELHDGETGGQTQKAAMVLENTPARIYAVEFDLPADHNRFEGTAMATGGSELRPNTIDTTLYWTLGAVNVPQISYDLCVDVGGLPLMQDHEQHVLVHRSGIGDRWRPLDTTTGANGTLCSSGLTGFGDIAVATYNDALPTSIDHAPNPEEQDQLPSRVALWQNYPNPFNPTTVIGFELPAGGEVRLEVYDMLGRRIATLVDGHREAGRHSATFEAGNLASGIYIYHITAGQYTATRRMTLVK